MFSLKKFIYISWFPIFALSFDVFAQLTNLPFLSPILCTNLWYFPWLNYFENFNSQYIHWGLKFSLKKLFFNFQCPISAPSLNIFPHEIILYFEFPTYALSFDFFTPEIILSSFEWLLGSIRRMFSLMKLFHNFQYPIYALSFDVFAQEIILQYLMPNSRTEL